MKKVCYIATIPSTIRAFFIPQLQFLSENGFDVTVICSPDETLQDELGDGVRYIALEIPRGIALGGSIKVVGALKQIFCQEKFELVQYSTPNAAMYASIAAKKTGIMKRNYHLMGFRFLGAKGFERFILRTLEKITCKISTSIECVSQSNLELGVQEKIFPKNKATVVWNGSSGGIDLKRFDIARRNEWRKEIREEFGYKNTDFVYGFAGRITGDKGINELLKAFLGLKDDSKLFLLGNIENENTLDSKLLNMAKSSCNIRFQSSVKDIERYYAAMDVLVLPSYREGFGNVVIEAGAVGTPAIVSDIPGPIDAIQQGITGYAVPVKNIQMLQDVMKRMRIIDSTKMGVNASIYVRDHFDSEILNHKILKRKLELLRD